MVQKRGTKAINKLCFLEILCLSFVCGAYFFEFRGWKQVRYACALPFSRVPTGIHLSCDSLVLHCASLRTAHNFL